MRRDLLTRHSHDVFQRVSQIRGRLTRATRRSAGLDERDRILACVGTESIPVSGGVKTSKRSRPAKAAGRSSHPL
jgi:hypothetical protein